MYLQDIPLPEAQSRLVEALKEANLWGIIGVEQIPLDEMAMGRVLAEPVWAKLSSPHYHAAAMDGYAVRSRETEGASQTQPLSMNVGDQSMYLDTGDPLPNWADAVVPVEFVEPLDLEGNPIPTDHSPQAIRIRAAVTPWKHIRPMGEDIVTTQLILPAGHTLRPVDLGAIAASGHDQVIASRCPKVAIIPTGSELVPIGSDVKPGDIIAFNSMVMASQVRDWGGEASRFPIIPDNLVQLCDQVSIAAQDHDLILLNAGSSAGAEDFSAEVVEQLGELLVHGVAVRPGHPVILGIIHPSLGPGEPDNLSGEVSEFKVKPTPIVGVPGYPVSTALTGEIFVEPLLSKWLGRKPAKHPSTKAILTRKITSPAGDDDFVRVVLGRVADRLLAAPLARGAGMITSLVRADGLALLPRGSQGLPAGEEVQVNLYRDMAEINNTIFASGSHDITLDLLSQFLYPVQRRLSSTNVGSIGGLIALQRNEAHLAGAHLLDPQSGEFNISYVKQYIPDTEVMIVTLVGRQQGLLVPKGNPKRILSLSDLVRPDVIFVNRQRGSGTRVLLDYHLDSLNLAKEMIRGYNHEEFTHLAVGAAIASGRSDCGLGIAAVTHALELEFIPLFDERYDLIIPKEFATSPLLAPLFKVLDDNNFRKIVAGLPGYDVEPMGRLIAELP